GREQSAEVGQPGRPEQRVGDRMTHRVGIRVPREREAGTVEGDATEHERARRRVRVGERVHVVPEADADAHAHETGTIARSLLAGMPGSLTLTRPAPSLVRYSPGCPARSRSRDRHHRSFATRRDARLAHAHETSSNAAAIIRSAGPVT